jgi:hypothetical protein
VTTEARLTWLFRPHFRLSLNTPNFSSIDKKYQNPNQSQSAKGLRHPQTHPTPNMGHVEPKKAPAVPSESTNSEESSSSMAYLAVESQASSLYCRVCWDSSEIDNLISPCSCKGKSQLMQQSSALWLDYSANC